MTRPVGTSAIWRGATVTSADAARSNPADSAVAYVGRGTVASSRLIRICIAAAYFVLLLVPLASGQDLKTVLPIDSSVKTGTLPNGLVYFIRRNPRPANRVLLRLAVQAGSVDEADDQRGLAHMLEHMAFNGTARFKPGELVSYLQSLGARFGPHVN